MMGQNNNGKFAGKIYFSLTGQEMAIENFFKSTFLRNPSHLKMTNKSIWTNALKFLFLNHAIECRIKSFIK